MKTAAFFSRPGAVLLLVLVAAFCGDRFARAQENLLSNPGFEESEPVRITKDAPAPWGELVRRGVDLPLGDAAPMPKGWSPAADTWQPVYRHIIRYVTGQAGKEVYAGQHALHVTADGFGAGSELVAFVGEQFPLGKEFDAAKKILPIGKPIRLTFYAKGEGMVYSRLDVYSPNGRTSVLPKEYAVHVYSPWQKRELTFLVNDPAATAAALVLQFQWIVTIDEVALTAGKQALVKSPPS